jgi:23S rRNA (guanosine2251-2'-O)-methyltransferase
VQLAEAARELAATRVYGLVAHGGAPLWSVELARPALVCVGAERAGLGEQVLRQVSDPVTIPLAQGGPAGVESLNAGVAGALALYEFARRSAGASGGGARPETDSDASGTAPASGRGGRRRPADDKE